MIPEVRAYSYKTLVKLITGHKDAEKDLIAKKQNLKYFRRYFEELKASTIVVEDPYIDKGFMEDYAAYYSRCFHRYDRDCKRLHFFDNKVSKAEVSNLLRRLLDNVPVETGAIRVLKRAEKAYLGFIVVKPLPRTVIGKTCLRTYPEIRGRTFPTSRSYEANLFGLKFQLQTVAFQEQDGSVSACATSALWSLLQASSALFQHHELSPVEITTAAAAHFPTETRSLPSHGLSAIQMADVIRSAGLEPVHQDTDDPFILKSTLYAYLSGGIPVILCLKADPDRATGIPKRHAVAVTGFKIGGSISPCNCEDQHCGFLLRATRMTQLYAHDDQVGPFATMIFDGDQPDAQGDVPAVQLLTPIGKKEQRVWHPLYLILPLYPKARIPYKGIFQATHAFDRYLRLSGAYAVPEGPEWEIGLIELNKFKTSLMWPDSHAPRVSNRAEILTAKLPRFMWCSTAWFNKKPVLSLLFDATDIDQGRLFVGPVEYEVGIRDALAEIAKGLFREFGEPFESTSAGSIFNWYRKNGGQMQAP